MYPLLTLLDPPKWSDCSLPQLATQQLPVNVNSDQKICFFCCIVLAILSTTNLPVAKLRLSFAAIDQPVQLAIEEKQTHQ